jgi:predicted RNA polymerase sigma factor
LRRGEHARDAYERPLELAPTETERRYLASRITELSSS